MACILTACILDRVTVDVSVALGYNYYLCDSLTCHEGENMCCHPPTYLRLALPIGSLLSSVPTPSSLLCRYCWKPSASLSLSLTKEKGDCPRQWINAAAYDIIVLSACAPVVGGGVYWIIERERNRCSCQWQSILYGFP